MSGRGGLGGKPKPGGAQTVRPGLGDRQVQPIFPSVVSVTPGEIAVSAEETSRAGNWTPEDVMEGPPNGTDVELVGEMG